MVILNSLLISIFINIFFRLLPVAQYCEGCSKKSIQKDLKLIYHNQAEELWTIFPLICSNCINLYISGKDITKSLPSIAQTLGAIMNDGKSQSIIISIVKGLHNLLYLVINKKTNDDNDLIILSQFSNNYLPILFNIFERYHGDWEEKIPLTGIGANGNMEYVNVIGETIQYYLKICDNKYVENLFNQCLLKVIQSSSVSSDISIIMLLYRCIKNISCNE